ncbi:IS110 family transposase [Paraburkholderia tropica]|uniref:IS110 family transposase n=1 Tax=Paraburkholderia tropica TaxID=92647 RepID=UPI0038BB7F93
MAVAQEHQQHSSVDVFVGVDVGKGHHHAVALDRSGKRLYNKALPNDEANHRHASSCPAARVLAQATRGSSQRS